ncbi:hypothetical protein C1H46_008174 [Malus baccata]|uniref:Uncharacterized protein n=1 Tax=Malus baccata TaxID=106549 RepID=A0A540N5C2_MALBA|nr:hypothetical protein C1H46_008174 [Malus baccata]
MIPEFHRNPTTAPSLARTTSLMLAVSCLRTSKKGASSLGKQSLKPSEAMGWEKRKIEIAETPEYCKN